MTYGWKLEDVDALTWIQIRGLMAKIKEAPSVDLIVAGMLKGMTEKNTVTLGKQASASGFKTKRVPKGTIGKGKKHG